MTTILVLYIFLNEMTLLQLSSVHQWKTFETQALRRKKRSNDRIQNVLFDEDEGIKANAVRPTKKWDAKSLERIVDDASPMRILHVLDSGIAEYTGSSSKNKIVRPVIASKAQPLSIQSISNCVWAQDEEGPDFK